MNEAQRQRMNLLAARFDEWLQATNRTMRTRETYERGVRQFLDWLEKSTTVETIAAVTPQLLQQYQVAIYSEEQYKNKRLSVGAQQLRLTIVRQFFSWLVRTQQIAYNPAANLVLPRVPKQLPQILTRDEVALMLAALPQKHPRDIRDQAILELLYSAGLRRAELLALKLYDVDLAVGTIKIEHGKGNKKRVLPLVESARGALTRYVKEARGKLTKAASQQLLFVSTRSGGPLDGNDIKRIVAKAAKRAGVKKRVTPHILRHSLATHLLASNADIRHIQKLLGHSKLSTTEIYTQVEVSDLANVLERCHPRAHKK